MLIRLLKAIVELVVVSAKLVYVYVFYPSSKTVKRAKKVLDPQYDEHIYGSGETLKDEWIQGSQGEEEKWMEEESVELLNEIYD